jgi:hypothetical protein
MAVGLLFSIGPCMKGSCILEVDVVVPSVFLGLRLTLSMVDTVDAMA